MNQSRTSHVSNAYSIKRTLSINNANGDCVLDVKLLEHLLCNLFFFSFEVKFYPFVISTLFGFCHIFLAEMPCIDSWS